MNEILDLSKPTLFVYAKMAWARGIKYIKVNPFFVEALVEVPVVDVTSSGLLGTRSFTDISSCVGSLQ